MGEPFILVVGEEEDWSANAVTAELDARDVRHYRLDTANFPQRMRLSAWFDGRWRGWIDVHDDTLWLEDVTAVFYRRPRDFEFAAGLSAPERRFAHAQARVGLGGVLSSLSARWMNHPAALADCEYKPRQLLIAAQAGLTVPATLVTNQADQLRCFAAEVGEFVLKPLAEPIVQEGDGYTAVYTRRLCTAELDDLDGVQVTAHYAQAWVPKRYDVRVTAVGGRLFPVAIRAGSEAARVDWRSDYPSLWYEVIECPADVAGGIQRFMTAFGLAYAAFDFAVDEASTFHFLECNASGQWGWLAEECTLPIAAAIADELLIRE